jgi:hypothetical protein
MAFNRCEFRIFIALKIKIKIIKKTVLILRAFYSQIRVVFLRVERSLYYCIFSAHPFSSSEKSKKWFLLYPHICDTLLKRSNRKSIPHVLL